jgi:hypothetical protein
VKVEKNHVKPANTANPVEPENLVKLKKLVDRHKRKNAHTGGNFDK